MPTKKMFKVLAPIERNGQTFWMRTGVGFPNRDDSINLHLDAIPFTGSGPIKLQIREMTDEDFARSSERKSEWQQRSTRADASLGMPLPVQMEAANANDAPF